MKNYIDTTGSIYALEDDGSQDFLIPHFGLTKITADEYAARISPSFETCRAKKIAEIETARDAACIANVVAHNRNWQADKRSQELLGQAISLAMAGLPLPSYWRDADNSNMPISSVAELLQVAGAIALQTQSAYANSWDKKSLIESATTIQELDAITW